MPAENINMKPADTRKSNKPIMEKRRRARINNCLNELKSLILEALKKDPARHSKLEKADILEMTVKHLQNLQRQQMAMAVTADARVLNKYRAGFGECVGEVSRYVTRLDGLDPALRQRLMTHLAQYLKGLHGLNELGTFGGSTAVGGLAAAAAAAAQPLQLQIPSAGASDLLPGFRFQQQSDAGSLFRGLQLIPTRLPTGEIVFLLPSGYASTVLTNSNSAKTDGLATEAAIAAAAAAATLPTPTPAASPPLAHKSDIYRGSPTLLLDDLSAGVESPSSPATAVAQDLSTKLRVNHPAEEMDLSVSSAEHDLGTRLTPPPHPCSNPEDPNETSNPWRPW